MKRIRGAHLLLFVLAVALLAFMWFDAEAEEQALSVRVQNKAVPPGGSYFQPMNSKGKEPVFFNTQNCGGSYFGSCFIREPERVPTRPAT